MNSDKVKDLSDTVRELGTLGTISYIGALFCFVAIFFVDFTKSSKGWGFIIFGVALLLFTGVIYSRDTSARAANRKEALGVLREVYNRLAEQTAKGNKNQTVSMTMTIAELPKKILEVLDKL